MGFGKSFKTMKVESARSGVVLGVRSVFVTASQVKLSPAWKPTRVKEPQETELRLMAYA